ncbi:hypothetical protein BAUCODRAFT_57308, partial [Baudoinia panamericana UAMH 10762]
VGSSYLLVTATGMPFGAPVSGVIGRRSTMAAGIFLFLFGLVIAAVPIDMPMSIAGRAVQGLRAGAVVVLTNIYLADMFVLASAV